MLLVSGWFAVSQTIIPEAQDHFLTPTARRHSYLFGGLGLIRQISDYGFRTDAAYLNNPTAVGTLHRSARGLNVVSSLPSRVIIAHRNQELFSVDPGGNWNPHPAGVNGPCEYLLVIPICYPFPLVRAFSVCVEHLVFNKLG